MKSYVTMEQHICIVCGHAFDTGAILLDQRLRERFEQRTITGNSLCPEHQKLFDEGYIALVAIDPQKSTFKPDETVQPKDAYRTGALAHVRRSIFEQLFNKPAPEGPLIFCEPFVIDRLQQLNEQSLKEEKDGSAT